MTLYLLSRLPHIWWIHLQCYGVFQHKLVCFFSCFIYDVIWRYTVHMTLYYLDYLMHGGSGYRGMVYFSMRFVIYSIIFYI